MKYVALLRGINVGGRTVKMDKLQQALKSKGFQNVKTILASGNVVFESSGKSVSSIQKKIRDIIKSAFGFDVELMVCTEEQINSLIKSNPFKSIKVTPNTKLYVTFLSEEAKPKMKIPYESPEKDIRILHVKDKTVSSMVILSPQKGTLDLMDILEREFGKKITTRNWNTILKLGRALS